MPDVAYVIVGDGDDLGYLHRLASESGVEKNVTFAGRVSEIRLLLYNADAFIMCSRKIAPSAEFSPRVSGSPCRKHPPAESP